MTDPDFNLEGMDIRELEVHTQKAPETAIIPKLKIDPPVVIICHSELRRWATKNALTLVFLNLYFFLTWVVIIVVNRIW